MGNLSVKGYSPTSKDYTKGGTGNFWRIYSAKKSSAGKEGSIFVFEKKKYKSMKLEKSSKEHNLEILRKEAQNLSRYMHPNVLKIMEPFHEDSNVMAFVTEPVTGTLAQIFEQKRDVPLRSDETELKIIIMELLEAIAYLNEQTNSVHLNISPENIFVSKDGKWKIGGFGFMSQSQAGGEFQATKITLGDNKSKCVNPNPSYSPIEVLENSKQIHIKSDIFSVAMILYNIFKLKSDKYGTPFYMPQPSEINAARQKIRDLDNNYAKDEFIKVFPDELKGLARRAVSSNPVDRPGIREFKLNPWFNDNLLRGLYNLGEFYKLELPKQKIYLKAFAKIVPKYSSRIVKERILPFLTDQLLNPNAMYEVVAILLYILQNKSIESDFERKEAIWPIFKKLLTSKKISGQVLYLIITYIDLVCDMLKTDEIKAHILNLFFKCFDCKVPLIQILTISRTEDLAKRIDFSEIKNKLLPRILLLCDDKDQKVKRAALRFIASKLSVCDASLAQNGLLKMIERNLVSGNSPSTNMLLLDILKEISSSFSTEIIASKVLPIMIPFLVNKSSTKVEFTHFLEAIKIFLNQIEKKRIIDLNNQPSTLATREEEDDKIEFVPLEKLIQEAKVEGEGFDFLFSNTPIQAESPAISHAFGAFTGPTSTPQTAQTLTTTSTPSQNPAPIFKDLNTTQPPQTTTNSTFDAFNNAGISAPPSKPKLPTKPRFGAPPEKKTNLGTNLGSKKNDAFGFVSSGSMAPQTQPKMDMFSGMNIKSSNSGTSGNAGFGGLGGGLTVKPARNNNTAGKMSAFDGIDLSTMNSGGSGTGTGFGGMGGGMGSVGGMGGGYGGTMNINTGNTTSGGLLGMGGGSTSMNTGNDILGGMGGMGGMNLGGVGSGGTKDDPFAGLVSTNTANTGQTGMGGMGGMGGLGSSTSTNTGGFGSMGGNGMSIGGGGGLLGMGGMSSGGGMGVQNMMGGGSGSQGGLLGMGMMSSNTGTNNNLLGGSNSNNQGGNNLLGAGSFGMGNGGLLGSNNASGGNNNNNSGGEFNLL